MKAIVTYSKFQDVDLIDLWLSVCIVKNDAPEMVLQRLWKDEYLKNLEQGIENDDPLDDEKFWCGTKMAMIGWPDGDTKEFYIVECKLGDNSMLDTLLN